MPRKPTGRPTGRPPGSGRLGEDHVRLTVRLPRALYEQLDTYAAGRSFTRRTPQLAICVREALEVYLDTKRQTRSVPIAGGDSIRQPESITPPKKDTKRQTRSVPTLPTALPEPSIRQTENGVSAYDPTKYVLGKLCKRRHDYQNTGQSLLSVRGRTCKECKTEDTRARRQTKRETVQTVR